MRKTNLFDKPNGIRPVDSLEGNRIHLVSQKESHGIVYSSSYDDKGWYKVILKNKEYYFTGSSVQFGMVNYLQKSLDSNYQPAVGFAKIEKFINENIELANLNCKTPKRRKTILKPGAYYAIKGKFTVNNKIYYNLTSYDSSQRFRYYDKQDTRYTCHFMAAGNLSIFDDPYEFTKKYASIKDESLLKELARLVGNNLNLEETKIQKMPLRYAKQNYVFVQAKIIATYETPSYIMYQEQGVYKKLSQFSGGYYINNVSIVDFDGDGSTEIVTDYSETRGSAGSLQVFGFDGNKFKLVSAFEKSYGNYNIAIKDKYIIYQRRSRKNKSLKNKKDYFTAKHLGKQFDSRFDGNDFRVLEYSKGSFKEIEKPRGLKIQSNLES